MKIIHFNIYKRRYNITSHTIVTVHNEDIKIFKKYCRNYKVIPYKVYILFNYTRGYEDLVAYYLKHKFYKHYDFENSLELLTLWTNLFNNFNKNNFSTIASLIENINSIKALLDLEPLKKDLHIVVNLFKIPFHEQGLFLNKSYEKKKQERNEHCFEDYYPLRDKINNLKSCTTILNIDETLTKIQNLLPNHDASLKDKYFFISLYFYNIAIYHYSNKNYTVSFNMLHRMIDIYFEYLCKDLGLSGGGFLITKYEQQLKSSSISFTQNEEDIFKKLNNSRNKLYLTHGLYSIRKIELKQMLYSLKKMIESKSGVDWKNKVKELDFSLKLKPLDLFKTEPSFNTYFRDKTEEVLR